MNPFIVKSKMKKHFLHLFLIILVVLLNIFVFMITPFIYKYLIDTVILNKKIEHLLLVVAAYFLSYLLVEVFDLIKEWLKSSLAQKIIKELRSEFYMNMKSTKYTYQSNLKENEILITLIDEIPDFTNDYLGSYVEILGNILRISFGIIVLAIINYKLLLIILGLLPLYITLTKILKKPISKNANEYNDIRREYTGTVLSGIKGNADIIINQKQKWDYHNFNNSFKKVIPNRVKRILLMRSAGDISFLFYWAVMMIIYYLGAKAVVNQSMTLGDVLLYVAYLDNIYSPSRVLLNCVTLIKGAKALAHNYIERNEDMKKSENVDSTLDDLEVTLFDKNIMYKGIKFEYDNGFRVTIDKCTFECGKAYALVGNSGEGKSTILKILSGLIKPDSGKLFIDGERKHTNSIVPQISYCLQEPYLFKELGIIGNISFSNMITEDVDFIEFVYETLGISLYKELKINELSGGQYKRIALARTFIKEAKIFIFDEPTSNLDNDRILGFYKIINYLKYKGKIVIISGHNLDLERFDGITEVKAGKTTG